MEGFQSGVPGNLAAEVEKLLAEKVSLEEELIQCKADKDFVWNLWKRLQSEKPDMASVISMVVAREKEKVEKKDQKVLEILSLKDEKIMEMRQALNSEKEETRVNKERLHELLIENDELKQKLDERENERVGKINVMEERTREIEEKNGYLQQLVKAYQEEKESKDNEVKENLEDINKEKNGLRTQVKELESKIEELNQDKTSLEDAIKTNTHLQEQIKDMQMNIEELTKKSEESQNQHNEAITALKLRESQLQEESKAAHFLSGEVKDKERELIRLRAEVAESKNGYDRAMGLIKEQTEVIEHLQGTQDQLYRVNEDHKQSYERDIASLQKENEDLQLLCTQYQSRQEHLQHEIGVLRQEKASLFEDVLTKERLIEELQISLDEPDRGPAASPTKRARLDSEQACRRCKELEEKLEVMQVENEELSDALQERSRRISSLQKTLKSTISSRHKSSDKQSPGGSSQRMDEEKDETVEIPSQDQVDTLLRKLDRCERKIEDHKRLVDLKDSELNEVRRAHNHRHQRYRLLKENYDLVQNQLRTFEKEPRERTPPERPSERALRHENSDGVWNELTHYRGEFEKLNKERHDVLEELDVLRVEHANDLTTIQELKLCLEEEKEGLHDKLNQENKRNEARYIAEARKTASVLKEEIAALKDLKLECENKIQGLDEEVLRLQEERKSFIDDNVALKKNMANLERQLEAASREIEDRIEECENLKMELVEKENRPAGSPVSKSPTFTKRLVEDTSDKLIKQQAKEIDMYDQQLKKIAQKILSPSKQPKSGSSPLRKESQATQTLEVSRTADFSSFVDFDNEGDEDAGICEVDARRRVGENTTSAKLDTSKKFQTPRGKKGLGAKKTPVKGEWASMKQRILSLTQQVAALRNAKDKAVKALNEEKTTSENLRSEFNTVLQRLQVSKNTIQTLNEDLRKCLKEKEELKAEEQNVIQQDNDAEIVRRRQEEKLKISSNEVSRLTCIIKTLRNENKELKEKLSETQERLSRIEKDLAQKKTFVEEMKNKLRKTQDTEERYADTVRDLEEKIRRLLDRETQKKLQIDSLKRQLEAETREKGKFQQQYYLSQEEVKKKMRLLSDTQSLRGQAEKAVTEMEAAATQQLQGLANKSEMAINSIHTKLDKANDMIEEFQALIKTLADELLADIDRTHYKIHELEELAEQEELSKPASRQAHDLACSILNMTSNDLDDFIKEDDKKSEETAARKMKENEWRNKIDSIMRKEVSFAAPLLEILLQIIEGRKSLEGRLIQLTN